MPLVGSVHEKQTCCYAEQAETQRPNAYPKDNPTGTAQEAGRYQRPCSNEKIAGENYKYDSGNFRPNDHFLASRPVARVARR